MGDLEEEFLTEARAAFHRKDYSKANELFSKAYHLCPSGQQREAILVEWRQNKVEYTLNIGAKPDKVFSLVDSGFKAILGAEFKMPHELEDGSFSRASVATKINDLPAFDQVPLLKGLQLNEEVEEMLDDSPPILTLQDFKAFLVEEEKALSLLEAKSKTKNFGSEDAASTSTGKMVCSEPSDEDNSQLDSASVLNLKSLSLPTNVFSCHGLWAENVSEYSKKFLMKEQFIKFGTVVDIEQHKRDKMVFVDYNNPNSPVEAIAFLSAYQEVDHIQADDESRPIRYHFRSTIVQRRKYSDHAVESSDECYNWRRNGCKSGASCARAHYPQNEGVDLQPPNITSNRRKKR